MIKLNISKREKNILIVTIAVVSMVLIYNLVLDGVFKSWVGYNKKISDDIKDLEKNIELLKNRNLVIRHYNSYVSNINTMPKILSIIEQNASSLGITTSNIRPRPVIDHGICKEYIVELHIEGGLGSITKLMSQLIEHPVIISIKKFELRRTEQESSIFKGIFVMSKAVLQ
ncbi:MAG: type 4a pilus biogenesis protein PilO [Candidatus Omnitrophota bacterium]